ncbi:hypothetical protein FRC11_007632 [Ceratobasidium sp. 423]|nr:hypothetical protein FRC11_007632 [Ceratobasidium sp. 423]
MRQARLPPSTNEEVDEIRSHLRGLQGSGTSGCLDETVAAAGGEPLPASTLHGATQPAVRGRGIERAEERARVHAARCWYVRCMVAGSGLIIEIIGLGPEGAIEPARFRASVFADPYSSEAGPSPVASFLKKGRDYFKDVANYHFPTFYPYDLSSRVSTEHPINHFYANESLDLGYGIYHFS